MKKRRTLITAFILSLIMITGSLSGPVFAAQTSEGTEDSAGEEETETEEEETVITAPAEQESLSTDSMNSEQAADEEIAASGSCGENAAWKLTGTESDLTLTISGSGEMDDFSESGIPWASRSSEVKTLVVEDGITNIGDHAFYSLDKLAEVSLPDSITSVGNYGFF